MAEIIILVLGPVAIAICVIAALRGTKARQVDDCPTWLKTNIYDNNGSDRKWGIK